MKEKGKSRVL